MARIDRQAVWKQLRWREQHAEQGAVVVAEPIVEDGRGVASRASTRRVRAPVEVYRDQGRITDRQYAAALLLYEDFAFGVEGASTGQPLIGVRAAMAPNHPSDLRLDAMTRHREAEAACGKDAKLVHAVVCLEMPIYRACIKVRRRARLAHRTLGVALDAVADYYERAGR